MMHQHSPISPERLRALAAAPHGHALRELRQIDPMWGREEGEGIPWVVHVTQEVTMGAYVRVTATSEDEATAIVETMLKKGKVRVYDHESDESPSVADVQPDTKRGAPNVQDPLLPGVA